MKRIISLVTALSITAMFLTGIPISVSAADDGIEINETNFPDEVFRNKVKGRSIDDNGDGFLSADEIADVKIFSVDNMSQKEENTIHNLKGIEFFTEMTEFYCRYNNVDSLDLSKNTKLTKIICLNSQINSLNVSNCTALTYLDCSINNLDTLDVSSNTELVDLYCGTNQLTELNVRNNTALEQLMCGSNKFTVLDISQNTALWSLNCGNNQLTDLDVSNNIALKNLHFYNNQISELDLSKNTNLYFMMCYNNPITSLDLSENPALYNLNCRDNLLTELDLSKKPALEVLQCQNNQLTSLDVSKNPELKNLRCGSNQLTSLNLSYNANLSSSSPQCVDNKYSVSTCVLDPADLPGEFDISKASDWTNATIIDDNKIFSLEAGNVTYTYDCGSGKTAEFTIVFPSRNLEKVEAKAADCTEDGNIEYYECSDCGYKFSTANPTASDILSDDDVRIAANGHTFAEDWSNDETNHWHAATCGHDVVADKSAHTWNDGVITTEPTEEVEGERTFTCTVCSAIKTESIDQLEHTHTYSNAWTSDETDHWHAATCNHDVISDKSAHTWNDGVVTKEPTEEIEGERTYTCTVCGETKTEKIPATGGTGTPDTPSENGNITTEVKPGENAPTTELKTPEDELIDAVLTPEEKEQTDSGVDIKIILKVEDGTNTAPAEDKASVEKKIDELTDYKLGQYLDVELLKIIGGNQENITQTKSEITVTFEIPEALRGKQGYSVIRVHEGETTVLADKDDEPNTVTIATDKFSTYALAYCEKSGGNTGGNRPRPPVESEPSESDTSTPSESEPTTSDTDTPSESGDGSSDGETTQPSDENSSTDVSDTAPSESAPNDNGENPATGIAVSCLPLATAVIVLTVVAKRKKK